MTQIEEKRKSKREQGEIKWLKNKNGEGDENNDEGENNNEEQ